MVDIDYKILAEAIKFYEAAGFVYKEVPWVVSNKVTDLTLPEEAGRIVCNIRPNILVGSAEQGFLHLMKKKHLPVGRYVACTPCFRDDIEDGLHFKYFMKVELIDTDIVSLTDTERHIKLEEIIKLASKFIQNYTPCKTVTTDKDSFDIVGEKSNIEIGSYGIRTSDIGDWIYGTGVALPRLSQVQNIEDSSD